MKYIFISLIMLCLTSCAITGESVYEGADGKTYRQVNAGISQLFFTRLACTVDEKNNNTK